MILLITSRADRGIIRIGLESFKDDEANSERTAEAKLMNYLSDRMITLVDNVTDLYRPRSANVAMAITGTCLLRAFAPAEIVEKKQ